MARVIFVDTSVLLNLLDVPNRNADREAVGAEYRRRISEGQLILPLSTVIETGNHIAHVADGGARRTCAETFVEMLRMIVADKTPFVLHEMGWDADFLSRLIGGGSTAVSFVDHLTQGLIGCGDLSIIVERDRYLARVARGTTAAIWTLDAGLLAYT
jgi:hypothetical protein